MVSLYRNKCLSFKFQVEKCKNHFKHKILLFIKKIINKSRRLHDFMIQNALMSTLINLLKYLSELFICAVKMYADHNVITYE